MSFGEVVDQLARSHNRLVHRTTEVPADQLQPLRAVADQCICPEAGTRVDAIIELALGPTTSFKPHPVKVDQVTGAQGNRSAGRVMWTRQHVVGDQL